MLEDIDNECEGLGCNRTDFVIEAVQEKLEGKIQEQESKQETKQKLEEIKEPHKIIIEDVKEEPKIIIKEVQQDNSYKPKIRMVLFNNKYIPFAKRYNI